MGCERLGGRQISIDGSQYKRKVVREIPIAGLKMVNGST